MSKEQQMNPLIDYGKLVNMIYQNEDFDFVAVAFEDDANDQKIRWRYAAGNQGQRFRKIVLRPGIGIAGLVIKTGKPYLDNHVSEKYDSDYMYRPIAKLEQLTAVAAIPIISAKPFLILGVLLSGYRGTQQMDHSSLLLLEHYLSRVKNL